MALAKTVVPVSRKSGGVKFAEQAYRYLREAILGGQLPPGAPVSRRGLAETLGMSSVPVSDAIARLEAEGFVESRPRAGTRVHVATAEEIRGNYVLREALETHSARLFAESAKDSYRRRLLAAAEKLDQSYIALGRDSIYNLERHARVERVHIRFHMLIAEATECPMLQAAIERSRVLLFNRIFTVSSEFNRFPERWHRDLAEVLVHRTPPQAAETMRLHVQFRQQEVLDQFRALAKGQREEPRMVRGPQRRTKAALLRMAGP